MTTEKAIYLEMIEAIFIHTGGRPENEAAAKACAEVALRYMEQSRQAAVIPALPHNTVVIEHTDNLIHLRTNHVPEWIRHLEALNQAIIKELNGGEVVCPAFSPDPNTTSATVCQSCGREKWQHGDGVSGSVE